MATGFLEVNFWGDTVGQVPVPPEMSAEIVKEFVLRRISALERWPEAANFDWSPDFFQAIRETRAAITEMKKQSPVITE